MNIRKVEDTEFVEYNSLTEFYDYITKTPFNRTFRDYRPLQSISSNYDFSQTNSFEEAVELFKNGWQDMSEKLTRTLNVEMGNMEKVMVTKNAVNVQGYQPIVPLFLNGIPANMVSRKMQPVKQKVITLNKAIAYRATVSKEQIVEQSIKALSIIKKLENQNYRCNLNIIFGSEKSRAYIIKIRIKSANERLNINKLSFPLAHPSMLRRLFLRFIEVYPNVPTGFRDGYGRPILPYVLRKAYPDEILLPQFINKDIKSINRLDDLERLDRI